MLKKTLMGIASFAAVLTAGNALAADGSVDWDADRAVLAGSGCVKDADAFIIDAGNDLSVIFTNLGFSLPGQSGAALAARKSCVVRVPAKIAKGLYIGELTQQVTYGITKTAGARGSVATRSTFFGFPVSPYTIRANYGTSINEPFLINTRKDRFLVDTQPNSWWGRWCSAQRNPRGLYQANFAVSGQRQNDFEDLIMFVDGLDLKYEVKAALQFCGVNN